MFVEDCDYGNYAMQSIMYIRLYILYIYIYLILSHVAISFNCSHCFADMYCCFVHIIKL